MAPSDIFNTIGPYLAYCAPLLAFGIAVAGAIGDTRDDQETGLKSIRTAGWIIIILAVATLTGSLYTTYDKNRELEEIHAEKSKRERIAARQMLRSLHQSFSGLQVAYRACSTGASFRSLEDLKSELIVDCFQKLNTLAKVLDPKYVKQDKTILRLMEEQSWTPGAGQGS